MDIKPYIAYLKLEQIPEPEGKQLLATDINLSAQEKNLIYAYCYPRQLLDRELPYRVKNYRAANNLPEEGLLSPNYGEVTLILEAGQTQQYGRFIKHLMHAFCNPDNVFQVSSSEEELDCCICGKKVYPLNFWETPEIFKSNVKNQEHLAYGSKESSVILCADCLTQLITAYNLVSEFDPGFLDWTKQLKKEDTQIEWGNLKLKV